MPTSQENKVKNTFENVSSELDRYIQVFRSGGLMWKAVDEMGGDTAWLVDIVDALGKAANAVDEAHMSAFSNTEESVEEGRMSDMLIHDSETLSKEEFAKKHGKDVADEYYEASIGAPDYNPAKASKQGPGYASLPQPIKLAGDSIWDKEVRNPPSVTMTDYEVEERDGMIEVVVIHDGPWEVYTDSGFEKAISDMIGTEVEFSEQGMQEDGRAHLEGSLEMESANLSRIKKLAGI